MALKKAFLLSVGILSSLQFSVCYAANNSALCKEGTITALSAGEVTRENMIKVCMGGTNCYVSHPDSGLNHSSGNALLTLLLYAKSTGATVKLYTHSTGTNAGCNNKEFDEVYLTS